MQLIGTALEQTEKNHYYADFLKKNPDVQDKTYEWKCWMLKKYFKDHILIEIIKIVLGVLLFILPKTDIYKNIGDKGIGTFILVICYVLGVILIGSGIMFSISHKRCLKNYKDYIWDEDGEIVEKIIKFYDRKN